MVTTNKMHVLLVAVILSKVNPSYQCGVTTHNVIANRALKWFDETDKQYEYHQIISDNIRAFQAGAAFPDWGYKCIASEFIPNLHKGSELAHWLPFQKETIRYIREFNGTKSRKNELIAFLFGLTSHSVADVLWHDIAYVEQTQQGFINALGHSNCPNHECGYSPHTISDTGGEFVAAYNVDLSFIKDSWRVPTSHIVNIYKRMGYTLEGGDITLDVCMTELYAEVEAVSKLSSEVLMSYFDKRAPFLFDEYQDWWMGGVNSNALWTTYCWNSTIDWLETGVPSNPHAKYCFPLTGAQYRYDYSTHVVESTKLMRSIIFDSGITPIVKIDKASKIDKVDKPDQIVFRPKNLKPNSLFAHSIAVCNFTGTSTQHTAFGAPGYNRQRGTVYIYRSDDPNNYFQIDYDTFTNKSQAMPGDRFGYSLECVDMNRDGYHDLVVGIPGRNAYPNMIYTGQIRIYYGGKYGKHGLNKKYVDYMGPKKYFNFGSTLDTGDLNGDGFNDLIIGVPSGYNGTSVVNYESGELWYILAGKDNRLNLMDISSANTIGAWNRMSRSKIITFKGSRYLITSMPDYPIMFSNTLKSVGKLACYNINDLDEPKLIWEIIGNFTNGQFGFSFDVDAKTDMLSVSAPTSTLTSAIDDLIGQGIVYTLELNQLFDNTRTFELGDLKINNTYTGSTFYARLGHVVEYDKHTLIMSEPYADVTGRVYMNTGECLSNNNLHSQYGFTLKTYYEPNTGKRHILVGAPRDSEIIENGGSTSLYALRG